MKRKLPKIEAKTPNIDKGGPVNISIQQASFYSFALLAILAASMVIISKNPVRAVLFLVLTFVATAGIWLLLEAEFLSIILVLVYVGAVMVLFLFVVMMLDIELASLQEGFTRYLPLGICVAALVVLGLAYAIGPKEFGLNQITPPIPHPENFSNIKLLGEILYDNYLYPFEIAGVLLLVAIIAAILLTYRGRRENKTIEPAVQVSVKKSDRLRVVKL
jgi:NADH-quinone oxidoreductase subunit J